MPRARIVINRDSGGASDPDGLLAHTLGAFRSAGWDVEGEAVPGAEIGDALGRAAATSSERIVVGGGDGTIRAAAEKAMECGAALGIITLGTMNLLAKDLRLPLDPMEAASALVDAEERELDVGVVNGVIFLHSSLIGVFPSIGVERERARREGGMLGYTGAAWGAARVVWRAPSVGVELQVDGRSQRLRTFAVVISNNKMRGDPAEPYRRARLDAGTLGLYLSRHSGRTGLFRLLMSIGMGRWKFDDDIHEHAAVEVVVNARRSLHVSNDGEIQRMSPPLRYTLKPRALRALVPRATPGPDA
jgi:diacylglycerol kinase family enzyme